MHTTTLTSFPALSRSLPATPGKRVADSSERPAALVESAELLQGHKTVGIMHNGSLYRLQATKLGKLILTK
jgi:hemin uptake protein HemP